MHGTRDCNALARHNTYTGFSPIYIFWFIPQKDPISASRAESAIALKTPHPFTSTRQSQLLRRNVVDCGVFKARQFWQRMVVSGTR
jgi:hypothetical protein